MRRLLLLVISLISLLFVNAHTRIIITDPGNPDWVYIGGDAIGIDDTAAISITILTDQLIDYVNIPIAFNGTALQYERCQFLGPFSEFDAISVEERPGDSMIVIMGWSNLYSPPNPYFNTNGVPLICAILYFTALPGTPEDTYPIEITFDPVTGPLFFGDTLGVNSWEPLYENGFLQVVSEQGFADSIIIGSDSGPVEEDCSVPIWVVNDEDVDQIIIPISFDETNFSLLGYQLMSDIYYWDNVIIEHIPGSGFISILGQALGDNPYLNTGGASEAIIELYFANNPSVPPGIYPLELVNHPQHGSVLFHGPSGSTWAPFYRNGFIEIIAPPSCNMAVDFIFGYGFCQSPSDDRRYSCRIRNYGINPAENVELAIAFPSLFIYQYSDPIASINANVLTWNIGTILPGGWYYVNWWVDIPAGLGNETVITIADITTITPDVDPDNNLREFEEIVGFSYDPNDKTADPLGYGSGHFVTRNNPLMYTVYFENSDSATLPATDILIVDTLDSRLDVTSIVIGPMSHPEPCSVWLDQSSRVVTCFCDDIMLPPNDNPPEGEGFFSYSIYPNWNVATGDILSNRAQIRFDQNEWIAAPEIGPAFVTIDVTRPVSRVLNLDYLLYDDNPFEVNWEGNDGIGSGVAYYDILVSQDGGPFTQWIDDALYTSATFYPEPDHAYAFYSIATDNLGLVENAPPQPDAFNIIMGGCIYIIGDANGEGIYNGLDVTYSVNYLKGLGGPPPNTCDCPGHGMLYAAADANGNCVFNGLDVTYSVNYLKGLGPAPSGCDDCEPVRGNAPKIGK